MQSLQLNNFSSIIQLILIEYVSVSRWQSAVDAYEAGLISLEEKDKYVDAFNERVPALLGKLHFTHSNEIYQQSYDLIKEWLASFSSLYTLK